MFPWRGDRPASDTGYLVTMTVVGLVLFIHIAIAEGLLRGAVQRGGLLWTFVRVAVVQVLLAGARAGLLELALQRGH